MQNSRYASLEISEFNNYSRCSSPLYNRRPNATILDESLRRRNLGFHPCVLTNMNQNINWEVFIEKFANKQARN